jgi:hypothetical protein
MFSNAPPGYLCSLWPEKIQPSPGGTVLNVHGPSGPIVLGPVGRDVVNTKISINRSWPDDYDSND